MREKFKLCLNKFRQWTIQKLGGVPKEKYDALYVRWNSMTPPLLPDSKPLYTKTDYRQVRKAERTMRVDKRMIADGAEDFYLRKLTVELAEWMLENKLVNIEVKEGYCGDIEIRATVDIVV